MNKNPEAPRRGVLLFVTPMAILIAVFMYIFFSSDEWTTPRVIGQVIFTALAIGLLVATISPEKGWWGIRLVTFIIFITYFSYLIDQLWLTDQALDFPDRKSQATPFNSILGFLTFGIPCLIYTLWGSTWGRLGTVEPENIKRSDIVVFYVAWGSQLLLLLLSVMLVITWGYRWWTGG